jgi:hypothetical protein
MCCSQVDEAMVSGIIVLLWWKAKTWRSISWQMCIDEHLPNIHAVSMCTCDKLDSAWEAPRATAFKSDTSARYEAILTGAMQRLPSHDMDCCG